MKATPARRSGSSLLGPAKLSRWLLGLTIAGSALAVGTVHTITLCAVVFVLAMAAAIGWWGAEPMSPRPGATLLLVTAIVLTAYTALQCVPMPIRWLIILAPHNADVWARALAPLHESGPRWAPLTLDPIGTRIEVLKGVAYILTFVTALRIARQREGARFLSGAIVLTGLLLATAALLHPAFGAHKVFGIYRPGSGIDERHIAPLLNPNNLAGYLNLALCLAFSALLVPEPVVPRPIVAAIVLLLGATQVWVASRGGVITMGLGVVLVLAITHIARSQPRPRGAVVALSLATGLVAALGVTMIVLGGSDEASSELLQADVSKLRMFGYAMRMLPAVPVFGSGRGTFESAFYAFRTDVNYVTYAYPENVVAQWILEWGLPLALAGLTAIALALRPGAVLARSATAAGAWAAVVALAVQNIGDLGSEIPGLALAGVVCGAIVVAGTPGHRPRWRAERWAKAPRFVAILGGAAALLAIATASKGLGHEVDDDRRTLHDAVQDPHLPERAMHELVREAMMRHPAEPYLPFVAAARAFNAHDENPIPWIGATLERASIYGPAHLLLARVVAARSPSQARMEYRLAMEQMPEAAWIAVQEAPAVIGGFNSAMEVVPNDTQGTTILEILSEALRIRLPSTCVRLDAELAARDPAKPGPAIRTANDAVDDIEAGDAAPWCTGAQRPKCLSGAMDRAKKAQQAAPAECQPYALQARVRVAAGDSSQGLKELQAATESVTRRVECLEKLEVIAHAVGDDVRAEAALDQIVAAGCSDDGECARNLTWVGHEEEVRGYPRKALALYKRVFERTPEDDWILVNIARLAAAAGLHAEAADYYERLSVRRPTETQWKRALQAEHEAALRAAVKL